MCPIPGCFSFSITTIREASYKIISGQNKQKSKETERCGFPKEPHKTKLQLMQLEKNLYPLMENKAQFKNEQKAIKKEV